MLTLLVEAFALFIENVALKMIAIKKPTTQLDSLVQVEG
jgi:hypothetical protein